MRPIRFLGTALLLALSSPARATIPPDPYKVEELAPGVFAIVRDVRSRGVADSNVLFIINDEDVVVVDANIYPASARQVIAEIRKRTNRPVRFVVNTHWHDDHVMGNAVYQQAFPGVAFIAHPVTRDSLLHEVAPSLVKNTTQEYPAAIKEMKGQLASGQGSDGRPLTTAQRDYIKRMIPIYEFFLKDIRGIPVVAPNVTITDSLVLHRGTRRIEVRWLGLGNTPGDLIVWLPQEKVVATGDLVVSPIPFAFGSFLGDWGRTLRAVESLGATTIMPGHGEVQHDGKYVDQLASMFDALWPQVQQATSSAPTADSARSLVNFAPWRERFAGTDARLGTAFDRLFAAPIVEATFAREHGPRKP
ncbi:MAG: MBL fold metallo-hydrolase [Gemmatimonadaceae bacterium]